MDKIELRTKDVISVDHGITEVLVFMKELELSMENIRIAKSILGDLRIILI